MLYIYKFEHFFKKKCSIIINLIISLGKTCIRIFISHFSNGTIFIIRENLDSIKILWRDQSGKKMKNYTMIRVVFITVSYTHSNYEKVFRTGFKLGVAE